MNRGTMMLNVWLPYPVKSCGIRCTSKSSISSSPVSTTPRRPPMRSRPSSPSTLSESTSSVRSRVRVVVTPEDVDERQEVDQPISDARRAPSLTAVVVHERGAELRPATRRHAHLVGEQLRVRSHQARTQIRQQNRRLGDTEGAEETRQQERIVAGQRDLVQRRGVGREQQSVVHRLRPRDLLPADAQRDVPVSRANAPEQDLGIPARERRRRSPRRSRTARAR